MNRVRAAAERCGFSRAAPLRPEALAFRQEVRDMCAANRCGNYGKSWSCPPACPSLEEMRQRAAGFGQGLLVQTVVQLGDAFDFEGMMAGERRHRDRFRQLAGLLREQLGEGAFLPMGAGVCGRCAACTCPGAPCRFPEERIISMEAYGLLVSQVCESCEIPYYYGPGTVAYVSCVLFNSHNPEPGANQNK